MIWFYLDGEDSREYGIYLQRTPEILSAEPDIEFKYVPGRAGSLTVDYGGFRDSEIELECYIKNKANIGDAYGYLRGARKLIISDNMERSYRAVFYGKAQADEVLNNMDAWTLIVPVRLKPFRYHEPEASEITITQSGALIENPGSAESAPLMTIYGAGNMTVTIGQYVLELENVSEGVMIDSDKMKLLNIDGVTRALDQEVDDFPLLEPGANYIHWTGGVSSIVIKPRWRDR